jgi:putative intracellular protease/amidase
MGNLFSSARHAVIGTAPEPDLIVIPGGSIGTEWIKCDPRVRDWLLQSPRARSAGSPLSAPGR